MTRQTSRRIVRSCPQSTRRVAARLGTAPPVSVRHPNSGVACSPARFSPLSTASGRGCPRPRQLPEFDRRTVCRDSRDGCPTFFWPLRDVPPQPGRRVKGELCARTMACWVTQLGHGRRHVPALQGRVVVRFDGPQGRAHAPSDMPLTTTGSFAGRGTSIVQAMSARVRPGRRPGLSYPAAPLALSPGRFSPRCCPRLTPRPLIAYR